MFNRVMNTVMNSCFFNNWRKNRCKVLENLLSFESSVITI